MQLKTQKLMVWMLVVCFAWLQMLSPLLHAHRSSENKLSNIGVHFHVDHLASFADSVPTLKNINAHGDLVNIDDTIVRDQEFKILAIVLVVVFLLPALAVCKLKIFAVPKLIVPLNLRRSSLAPRAPPYF